MKNVKGGFAYIDMGIYGEVTTAVAKNVASNELAVGGKIGTIAITSAGKITVTKGA